MNITIKNSVFNINDTEVVDSNIASRQKNATTPKKIGILGSQLRLNPLALSFPRPTQPSSYEQKKANEFYNGVTRLAETMALMPATDSSLLPSVKIPRFIYSPLGILVSVAAIANMW
ncbi:hypothetical protein Rin_00012930 [Candidatus Regiella insecticola 5.15]|uniref:Uncharacterized protein n=1 Tax=Candidatus Regiella insecticola 5.15 TaxID=1005043 RepID=G2GZR6_9ENTR|nr:hypothetical protein [Candidatus Regiella insecticola]EGY28767.1 hypothetical protein Rin_00012930 [Candidatus Regiella insecticola 5.15]